MKDISNSNFGLLIAYALPGFVVILAIIFWLTSRDNLRKYYTNLATFTNAKDNTMSNGMSKDKHGNHPKPQPRHDEKSDAEKAEKHAEAKAKPSKS